MAATVTLSSTTLGQNVGVSDQQVLVASTSGLLPGVRLFVDNELMAVTSLGVGSWVNVRRGVDGTSTAPHQSSSTLYIGNPDQFYSQDPVGRPSEAVPVSPYINVINGTVWLPQGDELPTGSANRWWQKQTTTYDVGGLGLRTSSQDPTVSS